MENNPLAVFDEQFIRTCQKRGMSLRQTKCALINSPIRKSLVNALVHEEITKTKVVMIVDKDDPILNKIKPTEGNK